jgi:hypothetical protein
MHSLNQAVGPYMSHTIRRGLAQGCAFWEFHQHGSPKFWGTGFIQMKRLHVHLSKGKMYYNIQYIKMGLA